MTREATNREALLSRLYNTGMQLADCLRLLGKHEESNQVEVWVLNFLKEIRNEERREQVV